MAAVVRGAVLRPGPDPTYADGDDATWMDVDWARLQRTLEIDGQTVNVLDTQPTSSAGTANGGSAPVLLFIHGWSSNWQIFLLNIAAFMDTHRVISLDLPGFGASELPPEPLSIRGYARLVDGVCDALGVERVSVVGNSMGGFIGGELALSFGTRVDRLVLVSAAGLSTEDLPRGPLLAAARLVAAGTPAAARFRDAVVHRPRLRRAAMQWVIRYPERLSVPLSQELVLSFGKPGFVDGLRAIFDYAYRERLPEIDIPVLIVWGTNDLLVPVGDAYRYARLIGPNARVEIFEDTGHAPMLERPSRFNAVLRGFLAGKEAPEAGVAGVPMDG
jgi:pimeloyl-ACP methyl ester carboxylesterase